MTEFEVDLMQVLNRIANAQERVADALETPAAPKVEPPAGCQHPEKMRVSFGPSDEWECAAARGGCGYRTPALVTNGG